MLVFALYAIEIFKKVENYFSWNFGKLKSAVLVHFLIKQENFI